MKKYCVYALVKNNKCVYVGCTKDIKNRLSKHKSSKDFDKYIIISSHENKVESLTAERSIIKFLSIFGSDELYNSKYDLLHYESLFCLELDTAKNNY